MSLPDPAPPRKFRRLGLWLPFAALILAAAAWTGAWLWARGEAERRMDLAVANLAKAGYQVGWKSRVLNGYPFRLDVTLTDFRVSEPSGWALEAPLFEAEGYMHAPGHWMLATPRGLTFVRPVGGAVAVTGVNLRASLKDLDKRPPSFSFQGVKLAFAPAAGAQPFALAGADKIEVHLRPGPDDEGGVFLKVDGAAAAPSALLGRVAAGKPVAIEWNSTLSKMSAFTGEDWPGAVRAWTAAGGTMTVRRAGITAGDAGIGVNSGSLSAGADGRLRGTLDVSLRQAPRILAALAETGAIAPQVAQVAAAVAEARADLTFEAGQTSLGPIPIGRAPVVHQPR